MPVSLARLWLALSVPGRDASWEPVARIPGVRQPLAALDRVRWPRQFVYLMAPL